MPAGRSGVGAGAVEIDGGTPRRARLKVIEGFGKQDLHTSCSAPSPRKPCWSPNNCPSYQDTRCHALIFSSFGEGFGLPMIEASFYGKPTVVLDTPIAREILGDAGFFRNADTLIDRIIELEDPYRYEIACEAAFRVSWASWEDYTPRVLDQLKKVAAEFFFAGVRAFKSVSGTDRHGEMHCKFG